MQDTTNPSPARPSRRRTGIAIAIVIAVAAVGALIAVHRDGGEPASAASPTTASTDIPTPATEPAGSTNPPTGVAQPASANPPATPAPPAPPAPPEPEPEPVLADGRHPVFLTDIDLDGHTVEFDLLQYLAVAEPEAYRVGHPNGDAGCGCDDDGPIHNDNPRLRRLPVTSDIHVVVQGSAPGTCDSPHTTTFAALPGYFPNGDHDYQPDTGHLGYNAFWLTVDHDTVTNLEEMPCAD